MAATPSTMLPLGTPAPDFRLPDTEGNVFSLADFDDSKALLVMFICNHCPFVRHIHKEIAAFGQEYQRKGLGIAAINSNDAEAYPADSPEMMREEAKSIGYTFPYLHDDTQEVARAYQAACTPDFFLFDSDRKLVYRGQFDSSRPDNGIRVTGEDLRRACDALLAGSPVPEDQKPSLGCNIKWRETAGGSAAG